MTKKRGLWNTIDMRNAITVLLTSKMPIRKAARNFQIPVTTLRRKLEDIKCGKEVDLSPNMGRYKLNDEYEYQLVSYVKWMNSRLMPFTRTEFLKFAYDLAVQMNLENQFNKNKNSAGRSFYYAFMTRHLNLSLNTLQSTKYQRTVGFNKTKVDIFFSKYKELIAEYRFTADRIYNCDETSVSIVQNNSNKVVSVSGKNVTVLLTINATGNVFVPPMFIFPNKKCVDQILMNNAPEGSIFTAEETGWITANSFKNWLEMFVRKSRPSEESPVLLILDGDASQKDFSVIFYAKKHHVHMLSLPPDTTHKMQPLDRAIMQPFKSAYVQACNLWMREHFPQKISLREIAGLVNTAYITVCDMDLAQSAFKCTGLWPINSEIFTEDDFDSIPSEIIWEPEILCKEISDENMEPALKNLNKSEWKVHKKAEPTQSVKPLNVFKSLNQLSH